MSQGAEARSFDHDPNRAQVWASGLTSTQVSAFETAAPDRTVGAKLQPFHDWNLRIGTQVSRSGADARSVSSTATWETFWAQAPSGSEPSFQLSTSGALADLGGAYSQSLSGTLALPLDRWLDGWSTQVKFSPNMALDVTGKSLGTGLTSEIVGQTVLSAPGDPYRSVLNLTLGYGLAGDTRPSASAMLEIKVFPNL